MDLHIVHISRCSGLQKRFNSILILQCNSQSEHASERREYHSVLKVSNSLCSYNLTVIAQDRGEGPRSSTTRVEITVLDENDNTPIFTNIESGVTCVEVTEVTNDTEHVATNSL